MSLPINNNIPSLTGQRSLAANTKALNNSLTRLSTGLRINRGADDPAGLIASENLRAALKVLEAETRAIERADMVASRADGALSELSGLFAEAEALAVASANTGGMSEAERDANQMQLDSILQTIDRVARTTDFNGDALLDGTAQINVANDSLSIGSVLPTSLGEVEIDGTTYRLSDVVSGGAGSLSSGSPAVAQQIIAAARKEITTLRGEIGAFQKNTLGPAQRANAVAIENITAAESQIRDTDFASEVAQLTRAQILSSANIGALAIANQNPQNVVRLLA
ncbi:MAG: flagellin [Planctomycetota bacterium]